jgi:hypothetical protein
LSGTAKLPVAALVANKEPAMTNDRGRPDVVLRRIVMRKIARYLSMFYEAETKLSPRLQAFLQWLDEQ